MVETLIDEEAKVEQEVKTQAQVVEVEVDQHHTHKDIKMVIEEEIGITTQVVLELLLTSLAQNLTRAIAVLEVQVQRDRGQAVDSKLPLIELIQDMEVRA